MRAVIWTSCCRISKLRLIWDLVAKLKSLVDIRFDVVGIVLEGDFDATVDR